MTAMRISCLLGIALVALVVLSGCSPNAATVTGTVTLDGQPLKTGDVSFHPAGGKGAVAYGKIDASGSYVVSTGDETGLAPGQYAVTVVATEAAPQPTGNVEVIPKVLTPMKYNTPETTDIKVEVKPGANEIPIELKS